jgi:hypothetical protein
MRPVNKTQLDAIASHGCQVPGCSHAHDNDNGALYFNQRCCLGEGVEVSYVFGSGVLKINCKNCHEPIMDVEVANGR